MHQHESAKHTPFVGDLAADAEVDTLDAIGRTGTDARYRGARRGAGRKGTTGGLRRGGDVSRFAGGFFLRLGQRSGQKQMAVEQLPLGPAFDGPIFFRSEKLIWVAVHVRRKPAIL